MQADVPLYPPGPEVVTPDPGAGQLVIGERRDKAAPLLSARGWTFMASPGEGHSPSPARVRIPSMQPW